MNPLKVHQISVWTDDAGNSGSGQATNHPHRLEHHEKATDGS
jgi:hypothetical protein